MHRTVTSVPAEPSFRPPNSACPCRLSAFTTGVTNVVRPRDTDGAACPDSGFRGWWRRRRR